MHTKTETQVAYDIDSSTQHAIHKLHQGDILNCSSEELQNQTEALLSLEMN